MLTRQYLEDLEYRVTGAWIEVRKKLGAEPLGRILMRALIL